MSKPHKNAPHVHAEIIKAWADGAEIEYFDDYDGRWLIATTPSWQTANSYRIKPEPKPDVVDFYWVQQHCLYTSSKQHQYNLKLTFDGETGKLKSAEVLE
jgi:hypothetical protein